MFDKKLTGFIVQSEDLRTREHDDNAIDTLSILVESFTGRTPEEIETAQAQAIAALKPLLLPELGTTAMEHVYGQWPGEETDEQIEQALKDLS
jgi:hypothetical protein